MTMRARSVLSNLCFALGGLFVCFSCAGVISLSFPGGGFVPLLVFTGLVWLCRYLRTEPLSFRSSTPTTLLGWFLAISVGAGFLLGYLYHLLWLQILAILAAVTCQLRRDLLVMRGA